MSTRKKHFGPHPECLKEYPRILNGLMGLNGETGECIDILKKHLYQGHAFDSEHMAKKELGDVAWYLPSAQKLSDMIWRRSSR